MRVRGVAVVPGHRRQRREEEHEAGQRGAHLFVVFLWGKNLRRLPSLTAVCVLFAKLEASACAVVPALRRGARPTSRRHTRHRPAHRASVLPYFRSSRRSPCRARVWVLFGDPSPPPKRTTGDSGGRHARRATRARQRYATRGTHHFDLHPRHSYHLTRPFLGSARLSLRLVVDRCRS